MSLPPKSRDAGYVTARRTPLVLPALAGGPPVDKEDNRLREIVRLGQDLDRRAEKMFAALRILYREGILEEASMRALRRQRELDTKHLIERYRRLLTDLKSTSQSERKKRLIDALLLRVEQREHRYLREKKILRLATELEENREEILHLEEVIRKFRGSRPALQAQERLDELAARQKELQSTHDRAVLDRDIAALENEIIIDEMLLETRRPGEQAGLQLQVKEAETRLRRLRQERDAARPPG